MGVARASVRRLRHPIALGMLVVSVACAVGVAIWAPWSGRAGWVLLWGALTYTAAVLVVRPRRIPAEEPVERPVPAAMASTDVPLEDLIRLTERALRDLNKPALLAASRLIPQLPRTLAVALDRETTAIIANPLEQARGLRLVLEASIERLKPSPREGVRLGESELLQYAIMYEKYMLGHPNTQILVRHSIGEHTFHDYRRQGIQAVAGDIASQEHQRPPGEKP